jgi:cell division septal protein FtsQ
MRRHYEVTDAIRLRANAHKGNLFLMIQFTMLLIRLYIAALTLLFLVLVVANHTLGTLEAIVITGALLYLIIDVRIDLQALKLEFRLLQDLEQRVCALLRMNS